MVKNLPVSAGDMVRSLVRKDPTCLGAAKPLSHNDWAHTRVLHSKGSHRNKCGQKPVHCNKM